MADSDRTRLKEVHATDLTEARVNEDFVDWLKNKGPTWLLVVLVALCAYIGIIRFKQYRLDKTDGAWSAFFAANLPGAFEDVAREHGDVGHLDMLAWLQGAEIQMQAVRANLKLAALNNTNPIDTDRLSVEERAQYLDHADELYGRVIEADDGSPDLALIAFSALTGRGAVAEGRGDDEDARVWYDRAAERATDRYPALASHARTRAETSADFSQPAPIPTEDEAQRLRSSLAEIPVPARVNEALGSIIEPAEDEAGSGE